MACEWQRRACAGKGLDRREFLKSGTAAVVAAAIAPRLAAEERQAEAPATLPRIVRVHDGRATSWDYSSNYYFDYVDQAVVNHMLDLGVMALTGAATAAAAWSSIFATYQPGDKVAVKINMNNYAGMSNQMDAIAPPINALCRGLVDQLGIPAGNIYVYDCARPIDYARVQSRVTYPVVFVEDGDSLAQADNNAPIYFRYIGTQYMPRVLTQAQHLINLPLMKDHFYVLATMAFKHHLGTTRPGPSYLHSNIHYNLSDLSANTHIRDKTRLILADALFGLWDGGPYGEPMPWDTFPGGPTPNSFFLGFDPVAHESVMIDYLLAEQQYHGVSETPHTYLHDAASYNHLGVHEHRDANGRYSLIDYVQVDAQAPALVAGTPAAGGGSRARLFERSGGLAQP
jgi:hypothetical protein